MSKKSDAFAVALLALLVIAAPVALAEEDEEPPRVSNIFFETDLRSALQDVAAQTGINIIPDQSVGGLITVELDDTPLDEALGKMLAGTGFDFVRIDDYYLVFSPDEGTESFAEISRLEIVKLNHIDASEAEQLLSPMFRTYVNVSDRSNSVVITASERVIERIRGDLEQLDIAPQHVLLDARVVAIERTDLFQIGVDWSLPDVTAGVFTDDEQIRDSASPVPWGVQIGYTPGREFTSALNVTLSLMQQNEELHIISSPQVMGQDGRTANISVTSEEYFEIGGDDAGARARLETIETGSILTIHPNIGSDGIIRLDIEVEVSDVVARGERDLPVVSRREGETTVEIESGGTVAIGGLVDTRLQQRERRVPLLGRIPLIGRLFRREEDDARSQEVAIFITATVVDRDDDAYRTGRRPARRRPATDIDRFREEIEAALEREFQ